MKIHLIETLERRLSSAMSRMSYEILRIEVIRIVIRTGQESTLHIGPRLNRHRTPL